MGTLAVILVAEENLALTVSPLCDVVTQIRDNSCQSGHITENCQRQKGRSRIVRCHRNSRVEMRAATRWHCVGKSGSPCKPNSGQFQLYTSWSAWMIELSSFGRNTSVNCFDSEL